MQTIKVLVGWCNHNYAATLDDHVPGAVVVTADTLDKLKLEIQDTLDFHVEGMIADGDSVPEWLKNHQYLFEYEFTPSALLKQVQQYTTLEALSRASGINKYQLSNYANGTKTPRPNQLQKINQGIRFISTAIANVTRLATSQKSQLSVE